MIHFIFYSGWSPDEIENCSRGWQIYWSFVFFRLSSNSSHQPLPKFSLERQVLVCSNEMNASSFFKTVASWVLASCLYSLLYTDDRPNQLSYVIPVEARWKPEGNSGRAVASQVFQGAQSFTNVYFAAIFFLRCSWQKYFMFFSIQFSFWQTSPLRSVHFESRPLTSNDWRSPHTQHSCCKYLYEAYKSAY